MVIVCRSMSSSILISVVLLYSYIVTGFFSCSVLVEFMPVCVISTSLYQFLYFGVVSVAFCALSFISFFVLLSVENVLVLELLVLQAYGLQLVQVVCVMLRQLTSLMRLAQYQFSFVQVSVIVSLPWLIYKLRSKGSILFSCLAAFFYFSVRVYNDWQGLQARLISAASSFLCFLFSLCSFFALFYFLQRQVQCYSVVISYYKCWFTESVIVCLSFFFILFTVSPSGPSFLVLLGIFLVCCYYVYSKLTLVLLSYGALCYNIERIVLFVIKIGSFSKELCFL